MGKRKISGERKVFLGKCMEENYIIDDFLKYDFVKIY